jgi:hypothetical protein
MRKDPCEPWPHFRETDFRFEARVDWPDHAIVMAANPFGKEAAPDVWGENVRLESYPPHRRASEFPGPLKLDPGGPDEMA